ncbi:uncharacterized protein PHALS_14975 [Plasmopara halstedii]|uniref:Uncharacterized protein n=1 Tax=Plasmopara halstedii TaxID=4781 RepID=A0A0P1A802_PLAHL|nr:uncharacterized protein PHALS_14975 [Plasmopara halstedii]CEG36766.1 hypothetical protein PHALS_14975 [Plasmopara halstedii]|eukprot:XP_024573135.1 hypothetical protein PHALS_14975 [Plasmopara halstedii]
MTIFFVSALNSVSNYRSTWYATEVFFSSLQLIYPFVAVSSSRAVCAFDRSYALRQCSRSCFANNFA